MKWRNSLKSLMMGVNNFVLCLILVFITSSCKSQISNNKPKTIVNSIKDSILSVMGKLRVITTFHFFLLNQKNHL